MRQKLGQQRLRRQPEMDIVMKDEEQDLEYSRDGDDGALAVTYEIIIRALLKRSPLSGEALDVSCGSAQLLCKTALAMPNMRFLGTDLSEQMLSLARKNAAAYRVENVELRTLDMFRIDTLGMHRFDLVTWCFAMHHCETAAQVVNVLDGMARVVKPGGTVFVFDINRPKTGPLAVALADLYNARQGSWFYQDALDSYKAAFSYDEVARILAGSELASARHVKPRFGDFFQLVCLSSTENHGVSPRSSLRYPWQKLDYSILRLGFAGQL